MRTLSQNIIAEGKDPLSVALDLTELYRLERKLFLAFMGSFTGASLLLTSLFFTFQFQVGGSLSALVSILLFISSVSVWRSTSKNAKTYEKRVSKYRMWSSGECESYRKSIKIFSKWSGKSPVELELLSREEVSRLAAKLLTEVAAKITAVVQSGTAIPKENRPILADKYLGDLNQAYEEVYQMLYNLDLIRETPDYYLQVAQERQLKLLQH